MTAIATYAGLGRKNQPAPPGWNAMEAVAITLVCEGFSQPPQVPRVDWQAYRDHVGLV